MALKLGHELRLSYRCWVCERDTLPALNNRECGDPENPDYKWCAFCHHEVPCAIRRKKSYQRRWDRHNAVELFERAEFLWRELNRLDPQEFPLE